MLPYHKIRIIAIKYAIETKNMNALKKTETSSTEKLFGYKYFK